jgi:hypothetical protein
MASSTKVLPVVAEPQEEEEEEEEEEDTDFDCQAMWRNVALAPVWASGDADSLRGPLAATLEPLELTKRRVQSVLAIACRHCMSPRCVGPALQGGLARAHSDQTSVRACTRYHPQAAGSRCGWGRRWWVVAGVCVVCVDIISFVIGGTCVCVCCVTLCSI